MENKYRLIVTIEVQGYLDVFGPLTPETISEAMKMSGRHESSENPHYHAMMSKYNGITRLMAEGKIKVQRIQLMDWQKLTVDNIPPIDQKILLWDKPVEQAIIGRLRLSKEWEVPGIVLTYLQGMTRFSHWSHITVPE